MTENKDASHEDIASLAETLKQIRTTLHSIDTRLDAADPSNRPLPQVSATSPASWLPLLRSAESHIEPHIDRWRSGLDALLVFIGLFTAIVSAFYVESSKGLKVDEAKRTNDLLVNLTEILLLTHQINFTATGMPFAQVFEADPSDVTVNVFWSIALVMSISIALLAVACRGFLASLTRSHYADAARRLTEIYTRWKRAELLLGPVVDFIPGIMMLPVLLFGLGFLGQLRGIILGMERQQTQAGLDAGWALCLVCSGITILALAGFFLHALLYTDASPFQSRLSIIIISVHRLLWTSLPMSFKDVDLKLWIKQSATHTRRHLSGSDQGTNVELTAISPDKSIPILPSVLQEHTELHEAPDPKDRTSAMTSDSKNKAGILSLEMCNVYHDVILFTEDDAYLDHSIASFLDLRNFARRLRRNNLAEHPDSSPFTHVEVRSLLYLLSAEASLNCNLTAANVIAKSDGGSFKDSLVTAACLADALLLSAERFHQRMGYDRKWEEVHTNALARVAIDYGFTFGQVQSSPIYELLLGSSLGPIASATQKRLTEYSLAVLLSQLRARKISVEPDLESEVVWGNVISDCLPSSSTLSKAEVMTSLRCLLFFPFCLPSSSESSSISSSIHEERQGVVTSLFRSLLRWLIRSDSNLEQRIEQIVGFCDIILSSDWKKQSSYSVQVIIGEVNNCFTEGFFIGVGQRRRALSFPRAQDDLTRLNIRALHFMSNALESFKDRVYGPHEDVTAVQAAYFVLSLSKKLQNTLDQNSVFHGLKQAFSRYASELYRCLPYASGRGHAGFLCDQAGELWPDLIGFLSEEIRADQDFREDFWDTDDDRFERRYIGLQSDGYGSLDAEEDALQSTWTLSSTTKISPFYIDRRDKQAGFTPPRLVREIIDNY